MSEDGKRLSVTKRVSSRGLETYVLVLEDCPADVAQVLKPLDIDGNGFLDKEEVIEAAHALTAERKENLKLKKITKLLLLGFLVTIAAVGGLVYGVVKANKDTEIPEGSSSLMVRGNSESEPVSVNSNKVTMPLGMIPFLPSDVVSKVTMLSILGDDDSGVVKYRTVASIDVLPKEGFVITSTVGDVLTWDSQNSSNQEMVVALTDGTSYTKSVFCVACSAMSVASTEKGLEAASVSIIEAFDLDDPARSDGESEGSGRRRKLWDSWRRYCRY